MNLKLLYITNKPNIAKIAESAGVDRIFIDLESLGKDERQAGKDTVKSNHTISDIKNVKNVLNQAELLVRINPTNENSKEEIEDVINQGADIIMLPMIRSLDDVKSFLSFVNDRCRTCLLIETKESVDMIDEIIKHAPKSEYFIGLNDLHISYGQNFMFEPLANGKVEHLCKRFKDLGLVYGFGGIARVGEGLLPAERIIAEHHRLKSSMVILSRTFCDISKSKDIDMIKKRMISGVKDIRDFEAELKNYSKQDYFENTKQVIKSVETIKNIILDKKGSDN